jgi:hypothetical protein
MQNIIALFLYFIVFIHCNSQNESDTLIVAPNIKKQRWLLCYLKN